MAGPSVIQHASTALVVIDVQTKLFAKMEERSEVLRNCQLLVKTANCLERPVVVTEQYPKGIGPTDPALMTSIEKSKVVEKDTFSCFKEKAFVNELEKLNLRHLVLCGIESHVCVYQTALDGLDLGFRIFVAADAVCSRKSEHKKLALAAMAKAGATIVPTETIVFQLLERCGTKEFKELLPLIK